MDPFDRALRVPASETKESECIDPAAKGVALLKTADTCLICMERLGIPAAPVKPKNGGCSCTYCACVPCWRRLKEHHDARQEPVRCLICKKHLGGYVYMPETGKSIWSVYMKLPLLAAQLDATYKDKIKCHQHHNGCPWEGSRLDFELNHLTTCGKIHVACPNGCRFYASRDAVRAHLEECPDRKDTCPLCKKVYFHHDMAGHNCPEATVLCLYCRENYKQKDIEVHGAECKLTFPMRAMTMLDNFSHLINALETRIEQLELAAKPAQNPRDQLEEKHQDHDEEKSPDQPEAQQKQSRSARRREAKRLAKPEH